MFRAIFIIAGLNLLTWGLCAKAITNNDLVISQVQITGGASKTNQDFISIYNKSDAIIDLNGLRLVKRTKTGTSDTTIKSWVSPTLLNPGAYHLWANNADGFALSLNAQSESSQTISDDNGIALREGSENTGTIIDSFAFGAASNIFVETSPYTTNHIGGQYYARTNNQDTNNNLQDFQILNYITPAVCGNGQVETDETCDDGNIINNDGCSALCQIETESISPGDIRINELMADPSSGDEWLELYNTTQKEIDLNNWTIEDGSATKTLLNSTIDKWLVITKPKGALNNSGDTVILKNKEGDIIDSITYGDWDDGDLTDNAPAATKPDSLARLRDGESTNNDKNDFSITNTITKGSANIITSQIDDPDEITVENNYDYSKDITLSEIFPNPKGVDSEAVNQEFIELFNKGQVTVNLAGWRIEIGESVMEINNTISAGGYLNLTTKNILPLTNDGATIKLFQPLRQTSYQSITYKKAPEEQSYALFDSSSWQWTSRPTPGQINFLALAPSANFEILDEPIIIGQNIRFDSSDSLIGPKTAIYSWTFGDGASSTLANPIHNFSKIGKTKVSLNIKTDYGISTISKTITILAAENTEDKMGNTEVTNQNDLLKNIVITDLLANPIGVDAKKEWLKLKNDGDELIDLKGFKIINNANKTLANFKNSFIINPGEEKTLDNKILTGTLGNTKQTISLVDQTNKVISSLSYEETIEGQSYLQSQVASNDSVSMALSSADKSTFTTAGIAISAPGIFSNQYFYFLPEQGEPLYEIYNSKKLFPKLKTGDQLIVTGEYSESETGPRLKIKDTSDIQIIGEEEIIVPKPSTSADLKLPPYPRLALVEGEIVSKKSPRIYLTDNQGEIEIYLASGTKLKTSNFTVGDKISVFGVLTTSNGTARLQPRSEEDIRKIETSDFSAASLTTPTDATTIDLTNKETTPKKTIIFYYLIAGGIVILATAIYFVYKK